MFGVGDLPKVRKNFGNIRAAYGTTSVTDPGEWAVVPQQATRWLVSIRFDNKSNQRKNVRNVPIYDKRER